MEEKMKVKLATLAKRECWSDDEDLVVFDYAGSNVDDAYEGGLRAGRTLLARELLGEFDG